MKGTLFTIALVLAILNVSAQTITGRLADENGQPVAYANVALYADSVLVKGTTTTDDGSFSLECRAGKYNLVASYVGYERLMVRCAAGDALGTLTLYAKQLETVTVTANRIVEEIDRFVVQPSPEEVEAAGRTLVLLDMLNLPGLRVDVALEQITVDGGLAVLQIDGKEVPVSRLSHLRADQIKRVEYNSNPGIRYLERGASGVINIILKEREDGGSIMAHGRSPLNGRVVNGMLRGDYHRGKSDFALEYTLEYRNYDNVPYELEDSYLDPSRTVTRSQRANKPFWYTNQTIHAEYAYRHNDSTLFVASVRDNISSSTHDYTGTMTETDNGVATSQAMQQHRHQTYNMPRLDLFYTHKMSRGQKLELNVVGDYAIDRYDNTLTYQSAGMPAEEYATSIDDHGYAISGEAAYSKRFSKGADDRPPLELRTGIQYQHNFSESEYTLYHTTSAMTKDNSYLYAEVQGAIGKNVGYSLGTGAKILNVTDGTDEQHYVRNLSTARLRWRIGERWTLTAMSQYVPVLPSLSSLSPVFQQTDNVEGQIGDPDLKPSESVFNRIMMRYTHPQGWYVESNCGTTHTFHPIISTYTYDPSRDLFVSTSHNADLYRSWFVDATVGVKDLWKCLRLSMKAAWSHYDSEGAGFSHSRDNFSAYANAQFYRKGFVAGANFTLLPLWTLHGEDYARMEMGQNLYLQYRWKNLTAMLIWHCPFNPDGYRYESEGISTVHPYYHTHWTGDNGNMVVLGLTWQMNFGKEYRKVEKTLQNGGYENGIVR